MSSFNASLLRERFVIRDALKGDDDDSSSIIALSNRLSLPFVSDDGTIRETLVVRAQNMHITARMAAQLAREFYDRGALTTRRQEYNWSKAYKATIKGYEAKWNPDHWVAVYHNGRLVFSEGAADHHAFLDIIEQCDARNKEGYEKSLEIAKDAFQQAGKKVEIDYDANIALVLNVKPDEGKCGIIVRGPNKTTTFNFSAKKFSGRVVRPSHCLSVSAAFLEGIQLTFFVGMTKQKLWYGLLERFSDDDRKCEDATKKIGRLNTATEQFENMFTIHYRPDKPNFSQMIEEAEDFAREVLKEEIKDKIASGEIDEEDWVV